MKAHRAAALAIFVCIPALAAAQSDLAGNVRDSTGRAITGASVRSSTADRAVRTGDDGRYTLRAIAAGQHVIEVRAVGYAPSVRRVTMPATGTTTLDVTLSDRVTTLGGIVSRETPAPGSVRPADDVLGTLLTVGAKSEVVETSQMNGNLAEKTGRQVFSRVPGIFVYDMDGSGNQVNVSTRGLDPHRSWEMNVRQDGVLMNSDLYGYPASHYSPPMEAIQRIELVRGTAALQYGSQFGGYLNYVTRRARTDAAAEFASNSSAGSFGLLSSYASLSGGVKGLSYQAYAQRRHSDGYRQNAKSDAEGQFIAAEWDATPTLSARFQFGRSAYLHRIPGPLNDSMFKADPTASTRRRNFFRPDILIPAAAITWNPNPATRLSAQLSGVYGSRSSIQFVGFANAPDTILTATGQYAPRQVDVDNFHSMTGEVRLTREYRAGLPMMLATGLALTNNDHHRRQLGTGTTGSDFDLTRTADFRRNVHYRTKNVALYAENEIGITDALAVVPGVRVERGRTKMTGTLAYYDPANLPTTVEHDFPLFGIRSTYRWSPSAETYGGWSESYRPMILQDLLPGSAIERTDPDVADASGWTAEMGQRGLWRGVVSYDVSGFVMRYNNRFGVLAGSDANGAYLLKTNVGSSTTRGVELSLEAPLFQVGAFSTRAFTATSFFDAKYIKGSVVSGGQNVSIVGNRVEVVPRWISRNGVQVNAWRGSMTALVSHVSETFADAVNTTTPTATGSVGLVPAYTVADLNTTIRIYERLRLRAGVSNVFDLHYFTKRPSFYPGPGVWPSDGRTLQLSLDFDLPVAR